MDWGVWSGDSRRRQDRPIASAAEESPLDTWIGTDCPVETRDRTIGLIQRGRRALVSELGNARLRGIPVK